MAEKNRELELKVEEVILQPDNAVIRRRKQINLREGLNKIKIINLDSNLDQESLQTIISGSNLIIHNTKFETYTINKYKIFEELRERERNNTYKKSEVTREQEDFFFLRDTYKKLKKLIPEQFSIGYINAKVSLEKYTDFIKYLEEIILGNYDKIKELDKQLKILNENSLEIEKNLLNMTKEEKKQKKGSVTLNIESKVSQNVDIQLEYLLSAGKWNMFYELEITKTSKEESIQLIKWVEITNTSEEEWIDTSIILTDKIRSEVSLSPPKLAFINPEEGIESDFLIPVQSIRLPTKVSIKNDQKAYKFEIGIVKISNYHYTYFWNACDFEDVMQILVLSFENYFYPGPINIFLDGIYISSINHLDFLPPMEEIGLPLKPIKIVKISKKGLNKDLKQTGMLKKVKEVKYLYELSVSNPYDHEIDMIVYERIPQPEKQNKFSIDYKSISLLPHKVFKNGRVRWDLKIPPKEIQIIDFNIILIKELKV